jgi:hypothetical protein
MSVARFAGTTNRSFSVTPLRPDDECDISRCARGLDSAAPGSDDTREADLADRANPFLYANCPRPPAGFANLAARGGPLQCAVDGTRAIPRNGTPERHVSRLPEELGRPSSPARRHRYSRVGRGRANNPPMRVWTGRPCYLRRGTSFQGRTGAKTPRFPPPARGFAS